MITCNNCGEQDIFKLIPDKKAVLKYRSECRNCRYIKQRKKKVILREKLKDYLKDKTCIECGISDWRVFEFDHQRDKKYDIGTMMALGTYKWETVLKEIEKCDIVCGNCHRRRTAKQFDWWRHMAAIKSQ